MASQRTLFHDEVIATDSLLGKLVETHRPQRVRRMLTFAWKPHKVECIMCTSRLRGI
jgi:hypothetical protein